MNTPLHIRELNRAREWYNPLRGLDVPRVVALLEEGERGKYDDLQKLNRMAEKRHPTLRALKHRRLAALKKLSWKIKIPSELPEGVTKSQAKAQQKLLRNRYEAIENLPVAIEFLALASFRGFSHLEPRHQDDDPSLPITRLVPVPQWHWLRDSQDFAVWRYDAEARGNETSSVAIDKADFIIREIDDPLCEIALLCFLRRTLGKTNWTAFQADYAVPSIFATLGENTPADKVKEWLALVEKVTGNSRGALPPGTTVDALELGKLDGVQFSNYIAGEDADLVLAGTSGKLTMLTASTGLNSDQGDVHEATFDALAQAEAAEISSILQAQFDKPILATEFPSQRPVAYFELAAEDQEDVGALADQVQKFHSAGLDADEEEISEMAGITLTRREVTLPPAAGAAPAAAGDPAADPQQDPAAADAAKPDAKKQAAKSGATPDAFANRSPELDAATAMRFEAAAVRQLGEAERTALQPLLERVGALVDLGDAEFQAGIEKLRADLPDLEAQCLGDKAQADLDRAFSDVLATALRSGMEAGAAARGTNPRKTAKAK